MIWKAFAKITFLIWTLDFHQWYFKNNPGITFRFFAMSFHFIWLCKHTIQDYSFAKILSNHHMMIGSNSALQGKTAHLESMAQAHKILLVVPHTPHCMMYVLLYCLRKAKITPIEKRRMWLQRIEDLKSSFAHRWERARAVSGNRISKGAVRENLILDSFSFLCIH